MTALGEEDGELFAWARNSDPATSHAAAASQTSDKIRESQQHILGLLKSFGPMTDTQIFALVDIRMSPSGARSRRSELVDLGLVKDSGTRVRLDSGRMSIVWEAK